MIASSIEDLLLVLGADPGENVVHLFEWSAGVVPRSYVEEGLTDAGDALGVVDPVSRATDASQTG
jgi:hypothetical protein